MNDPSRINSVPPAAVHDARESAANDGSEGKDQAQRPREYGGRKDGTEPTRFGDWEKNGRCVDF